MSDNTPTILIAGGGTGGHVFPALAVADALTEMADVRVVFVGTERGLESRVVPARGYTLETLRVEPMKGGGLARAVRGGTVASAATLRSASLLARHKPRAVLSVGGYAAGPVSFAAALVRTPVALLEPNAVMGLANRLLAPLCKRAYVTWPEAAKNVRSGAMRAYGVPLREGFTEAPAYAPRAGVARVLVLGGSQGATALNERMPEAMARLARDVPHVEVTHQTGKDREAEVRAAYEREGFPRANVVPFLDDIARAMVDSDVIVGRSGASTVAEITALGRAAIFVPFPFAADDHQAKNAEAVVRVGGAVAIRQEAADAIRLSRELALLFQSDETRTRMAEASRSVGRPRAAHDIASDLLALAGIDFSGSRGRVSPAASGAAEPTTSSEPAPPAPISSEDLPKTSAATYGQRRACSAGASGTSIS